ncbi:MAG: hypothetical protein ACYTEX_19480, partial [Planctomycetota bacterium]
MKRNWAFALLVLIVALAGCGPRMTVPVTGGPLSEVEKQYLGKGHRYDKNGWIYLHIEGKPFERGFQRGYLTADEIDG